MNKIKLTALPCICADVFYGTEIIRPGGEALNFAAHASHFKDIDVTLLGVVGKDKYAEAIMDSISKLDIEKKHIRIDERYQTANNMTYLTESGDRYYKDDSWNGEILDNIVLNDNEIKILSRSDVVFVHFWASCFSQVVELKETLGFKLAVDFDVYRDFADMERFAPHVDFFSIGTNDLTQYTLAIDRQNNRLDRFYNPHHEAVLRMIQMTVDGAHKHGKWVGICGELGADTTLTTRFVQMGIDELSVAPSMVLNVRSKICEME